MSAVCWRIVSGVSPRTAWWDLPHQGLHWRYHQGAINEEQAIARTELFLDRQELRSGLLVSRRSQSYRFAHLTFQEYLAAWHLSNQELDAALQLIRPHLRRQKWFEVLQLLGGEWAKQSDEKLDRYFAWLLEQQGTAITDRAPVVALCANIVKNASGVAELKPQTRQSYRTAIQGTLAAFHSRSRVPDKTQAACWGIEQSITITNARHRPRQQKLIHKRPARAMNKQSHMQPLQPRRVAMGQR